ncbi:TetR/AcrR family transcriptional regulator [Bacillus sp. AK128]
MSSKIDRRKKYTQMVLKDSLIQLLKDKPISSITIKEICEVADINRSTFYSHYSNQYDLLYSIEDELIEDMVTTLTQYNFSKEEDSLKMTEKVLEYIAVKSDLCQILLSENSDTHFEKKGMMIMKEHIYKNWITNIHADEDTFDYISLFIVSGSIYVIKKWLENGLNKSPKEMAGIINDISNKGLSGI